MEPFTLYAAQTCLEASRVAAAQSFDLTQPLTEAGVTLFRRSLWLPVAAAARRADALRLAAGAALALRFAPLEFSVPVSDRAWLPEYTAGVDSASLTLALPVPLMAVEGDGAGPIGLHRRDGKVISAEAVVSGQLNAALPQAFVGTALTLKYPLVVRRERLLIERVGQHVTSRAAPGAAAIGIVDQAESKLLRHIGVVDALRLAGRPTRPRLRLVRPGEGGAPDETLWLDLLPGEHATAVTLPATADLAAAWAPALERLTVADAQAADLVLRLEIESDAPCRVSVQALALALQAETDLLPAPQTLRFSGARLETQVVALQLASGPVQRLSVSGTMQGGAGGAAVHGAALPADGRHGVLLDAERRVVRALDIGAPAHVAGLSLAWHPLSDSVSWVVQCCADAGGEPAARPLFEARVSAVTPVAAWMALRWPPLDLQAGRYWLRLAVAEGAGLWLADDDAAAEGWVESAFAQSAERGPLGGAPAVEWLTGDGAAAPTLAMRLAGQALAVGVDAATAPVKLSAEIDFGDGAALGAASIEIDCAQALTLKLESVRVNQAY